MQSDPILVPEKLCCICLATLYLLSLVHRLQLAAAIRSFDVQVAYLYGGLLLFLQDQSAVRRFYHRPW